MNYGSTCILTSTFMISCRKCNGLYFTSRFVSHDILLLVPKFVVMVCYRWYQRHYVFRLSVPLCVRACVHACRAEAFSYTGLPLTSSFMNIIQNNCHVHFVENKKKMTNSLLTFLFSTLNRISWSGYFQPSHRIVMLQLVVIVTQRWLCSLRHVGIDN